MRKNPDLEVLQALAGFLEETRRKAMPNKIETIPAKDPNKRCSMSFFVLMFVSGEISSW